jgi:hypothetical protein
MKYVRLIHRGDTPVPGTEAWGRLSEDERKEVYGAYQAIAETPGVTWRRPRRLRPRTRARSPGRREAAGRAEGRWNNCGSLSV